MAGNSENSNAARDIPVTASAATPPAAPRPRRFRYTDAPSPLGAANNAAAVALPLPPGAPGGAGLPLDWNRLLMVLAAVVCGILLLYPRDLLALINRWSTESGWSHGFVVPLISLFFIRIKWETLRRLVPNGSWAGLPVLVVGVLGQVLFRATGVGHMSELSILVVLFGAVLFIFGWEHLKILWLPIAFLAFALPPPKELYDQMTAPMQRIAANIGAGLLPIFGGEGTVLGTTIDVSFGGKHLARPLLVEEACSGMKMLVAFFALAVALGYSTERPMWQKVTLAAFALPIAIFCNALRVTLTAVMAGKLGSEWGEGNAHEYLGMLMLVPALLLQMGVAWVLERLFVEVPDDTKVAA